MALTDDAAELKRSFSQIGMMGFCLSVCSPWSALAGLLTVGLQAGGPPVMIWSWVGVSLCSVAVALCMAEMSSAWPVAGGQYSWVALLAPPKIVREMSYLCAW